MRTVIDSNWIRDRYRCQQCWTIRYSFRNHNVHVKWSTSSSFPIQQGSTHAPCVSHAIIEWSIDQFSAYLVCSTTLPLVFERERIHYLFQSDSVLISRVVYQTSITNYHLYNVEYKNTNWNDITGSICFDDDSLQNCNATVYQKTKSTILIYRLLLLPCPSLSDTRLLVLLSSLFVTGDLPHLRSMETAPPKSHAHDASCTGECRPVAPSLK